MNESNDSTEVYEEQLPGFQTIGKFLYSEREKQNLTLREVSKNTKIGRTMLELLESDELDQLPNRAYVAGYVKSYAKEVSVDVNMALKILEETYNRFEGAQKSPERKARTKKKSKATTPQIRIPLPKLITGLGIVGLIGMSYVYFANAPKKDEIPTLAQEEVTPTTVSETTPLQKEQVPEVKVLPEEATPQVEAPKAITAKKKVFKKEGTEKEKTKRKTLRPIYGPLYSALETSTEELKKIPAKIRGQYIKGQQNLVIISKNESTWMTYKKDEENIKQFRLRKNGKLLISGNEIRLFFGNINATEIFLNDKKLKTPSKTGVKSLIVPGTNSSKYKLPLFIYKKDGSGRVLTSEEYEKEVN